jgi:membrane-associated phospholipid phosphatase
MQLRDDLPGEERIGHRDLATWTTGAGRWLVAVVLRTTGWATAHVVLALAVVVGAVLVVGLTAASAEIYEAVDEGEGISRWDRPALHAAMALRTGANTRVATVFTDLGGPLGMTVIAACITVAMTLLWRSRTPLILLAVGVSGSLAMTTVGKSLVGRVRPPLADAVPPFEHSPSFPSGHTLNSTVIAGIVAYLLLLRLESNLARVLTVVLAAAWAVAMGLSRVFLGHHWLTDVAVGWTLGLAWVGVLVLSHRLFLTARRRPAQPGSRSIRSRTMVDSES